MEAAVFDATSVRLTAQALGLRTESSSRFEKGLDASNCKRAIDRACELIEALEVGDVAKDWITCDGMRPEPVELELHPAAIHAFLGVEIPVEDMVDLLINLGCAKVGEQRYRMPTFRPDLQCEADLAEEFARFYGYNRLPATLLAGQETTLGGYNTVQVLRHLTRETLVGFGYAEALTNPLQPIHVSVDQDQSQQRVRFINQNATGLTLRTTLLPSLLEVVKHNANRDVNHGQFFEIGYGYTYDQSLLKAQEVEHLGLVHYDAQIKRFEPDSFFQVKGEVEALLHQLGINVYTWTAIEHHPYLHPYATAALTLDSDECVGYIGAVSPQYAQELDVPQNTICAEIRLAPLWQAANLVRSQQPLPKFPGMKRDLAFVVSEEVPIGKMMATLKQAGGEALVSCDLFDVYVGDHVPNGYQSVAFTFLFRLLDRTLTDEEVNQRIEHLIQTMQDTYQATLRT